MTGWIAETLFETTLLMALPVIGYLLLGRRAREAMPGIRDWLTTNAWLVNIIVIFLRNSKRNRIKVL